WERTHACRFDIGKFQLSHYTRNRLKYADTPLMIGQHIIPPTTTVRYLGLIIDNRLRWKQQTEHAMAKGTSALMALGRLARSTYGLGQKQARQLYICAVVP
ncbi:hypothetical protein DL93DRAFT_2038117, partial [Clavulina sp. PMI_390]